MTRRVQTQLTEERIAKAEEIFDVLDGEDLRLNGCACKESGLCYLHAHALPAAIETWSALVDAYFALLEAARQMSESVVHQRHSTDGSVTVEMEAAFWHEFRAAVSVGSPETSGK